MHPALSTMKYLVLLFLVGFASAASIHRASNEKENEIAKDFTIATSLINVLELDDSQPADESGDGEASEIETKVREQFEKVLQNIKDAIDKGSVVTKDLIEKAKELKQKLNDLKVGMSDKGRELLEKIKEGAFICLHSLADKLSRMLVISIGEDGMQISLTPLEQFKEIFTETLRDLKDAVVDDAVDMKTLKERIEGLFGKGIVTKQMMATLKQGGENAKKKLLELIGKFSIEDEKSEARSASDLWDKVRDYFDKIKLEIKEKYLTFGEWVRGKMGQTLDSLKDKGDKAKEIAKELKENAESLSKEILAEGLEFLRPYKNDLGERWDQLKDAAKKVLDKQD